MMTRKKTILTAQEVAKRLGVHLFTVYEYLKSGLLKGHKLGGNSDSKRHWRIKVTDLDNFIEGSAGEQGSDLQ